jgi:hypothetical protein
VGTAQFARTKQRAFQTLLLNRVMDAAIHAVLVTDYKQLHLALSLIIALMAQ